MKTKIIGMLVCIMLMTTFFSVATNIKDLQSQELSQIETPISTFDDDVPVWNKDDTWSYSIDDIDLNINEENQTIRFHLQIDEFSFEVADDTGDYYKLDFSAGVKGDFLVDVDLGDGPINITGNIQGKITSDKASMKGFMLFNKSDLGIKKINGTISGRLDIIVNENPYEIPFSIPPIPVPADIVIDAEWSVPYTLLDFPLNTSKMWGLPATNITLSGKIESPWLNFVNVLNNILRIPIVTQVVAAITEMDPEKIKQASDILYDILPVINIDYVITKYLNISNTFEIPEIPAPILYCNKTVEVSTEAGDFVAYEISILGELGKIYYAPELKNIIKISGELGDILPFLTNIEMELTDYQLT